MNMINISINAEIVRHLLHKSRQKQVIRCLLPMHNEIKMNRADNILPLENLHDD